MLEGRDLLRAIELLDARPWEGDVWRHTISSSNELSPNTGGARWNARGTAALYTSLERETAIAEGDHLIAMQSIPPTTVRTLHRVHTSVERMVVLDEEALATIGLTLAGLGMSNLEPCQAVGWAVTVLDRDGLLVPSLRREGGSNLVLYIDNQSPHAELTTVESEQL